MRKSGKKQKMEFSVKVKVYTKKTDRFLNLNFKMDEKIKLKSKNEENLILKIQSFNENGYWEIKFIAKKRCKF